MKTKRSTKKADTKQQSKPAETNTYTEWSPPSPCPGITQYPPLSLAVCTDPPIKEEKEHVLETQKIPLIDTTTKNYIPRIDYTVFIEGDEEISKSLI